jgi:hypothetical protein
LSAVEAVFVLMSREHHDYNINHITITPSRHRHIPRENTALA